MSDATPGSTPSTSRPGHAPAMVFGLTRSRIVQGLKVMCAIGVVVAIFGVVAALRADPSKAPSLARRVALVLYLFAVPPGIWLAFLPLLASITLRLEDGRIEQVLWGRFVLQSRSVADLMKVTGGDFSAMVLHFRGKRRMALPGIYVEDRARLVELLDRLRPELGLLDQD